jgi:hypothetical protein
MGGDFKSYLPYIKWIPLLIFLVLCFLTIFRKIRDKRLIGTVTNLYRGTRSERELVLKLLKHGIPANTIFHDLYVKKTGSGFSQIDLVVATNVGIIVFEVKDYSGWIFGNGQQREWTQVLAYGKEYYHFYNPIMQNNKHIAELRKKLKQFENIPFYSIIVFFGKCVLNDINFVPRKTYIVKSDSVLEVVDIILVNNDLAPFTDKSEVVKILSEAVQNGKNKAIKTQHIENIEQMLGKHKI